MEVITKMDDFCAKARVLIVEDHALIAEGVAVALRAEGLEVAVATGPTADAIVEDAARFAPDVVLLDLHLGGIGSGLPLIKRFRELEAEVIVLTGVTDRTQLASTVEQGAAGLASKSDPFDHLLEKVHQAARHERCLSTYERDELLAHLNHHRAAEKARLAPFMHLTTREQEVLAELIEGRSAEAIASSSFVSLATVRTQIRSILQKLGVSSQLAAVAMARQLDWRLDRAGKVMVAS
jgi:two-component system nitrate/nitrite response regulator NarL